MRHILCQNGKCKLEVKVTTVIARERDIVKARTNYCIHAKQLSVCIITLVCLILKFLKVLILEVCVCDTNLVCVKAD